MALVEQPPAHRTSCATTRTKSWASNKRGTICQMFIASNSTTQSSIAHSLQIKMKNSLQRRRSYQPPSAPAQTPAPVVAAAGEASMMSIGSVRAHGNVLDQEQLDLEERGNAQIEPRLRRRRHHDSLRDGQRRPGGHS